MVLPRPVRVFDSRSSGNGARLGTGSVRTVTLTPEVPVGATGAIVNLMVLSTVGSGAVAAYAAGTAAGAGVLRWFASNQMLDNQVTVPLNAAAQMSLVVKSGSTHVVADVVGYLVADLIRVRPRDGSRTRRRASRRAGAGRARPRHRAAPRG